MRQLSDGKVIVKVDVSQLKPFYGRPKKIVIPPEAAREVRSGVENSVQPQEAWVLGIDWIKLTLVLFFVIGEQLSVERPGRPLGSLPLSLRKPGLQGIVASEFGGFDEVGSVYRSPDSLEVFYDSVNGLLGACAGGSS